MARGGGKLIPFLMEALFRNIYANLKYESSSSDIFYLEFPRFRKNKMSSYERILIDWYQCTGKRYPGYSHAKAVLKAALKKSIYLVRLQTLENKLRFRLSDQKEIEEKKQYLKLKAMTEEVWNENDGNFSPPPNPPSVASSGYVSGSEESDESMAVKQENNFRGDENLNSEIVMVHLTDEKVEYDIQLPQMIFQDEGNIDQFPQDFEELQKYLDGEPTNFNESLLVEESSNNLCDDACASSNNLRDDASPSRSLNDPVQQPLQPDALLNQVVDLESTPVIKTFWYLEQKIKLKDMLISVCEKRVLLSENQGIQEGGVYIPSDFWEGETYSLEKDFQLQEKYFCFFRHV